MATSILIFALPPEVACRTCERHLSLIAGIHRPLCRPSSSKWRATFFSSDGKPVSSSSKNGVAFGREFGLSSQELSVFYQGRGRRGVLAQAQEKDEGGAQGDDDAKPFYAVLEFWIQAAVVVLTFGFVDAGYSGDWSRIGTLSTETEAQLRTAAYVVVPFSAALVWTIGKRKKSL